MKDHFITFRSVTYAQRGESVLRAAGIRCALLRTPRWMEAQGCGYCLRLKWSDLNRALELLRMRQVSFRKIFAREHGDAAQEVVL